MLTKQRQDLILKLLAEKGSITATEVKDILGISESTVRRDITALDKEGKLVKVFGGAVAAEVEVSTCEYTVKQKSDLHPDEKKKIAKYAASLIKPEDFVYLDAGTTTAYMLEYIEEQNATYVTNAVVHARQLLSRGMKVLMVGGELKASTEAAVGSLAVEMLESYHFTKGFFGTNGVNKKCGCTTPDVNEAMVKRTAIGRCKESYVLCDSSKFLHISPVTFASFEETVFLTERVLEGYEGCENVVVVD